MIRKYNCSNEGCCVCLFDQVHTVRIRFSKEFQGPKWKHSHSKKVLVSCNDVTHKVAIFAHLNSDSALDSVGKNPKQGDVDRDTPLYNISLSKYIYSCVLGTGWIPSRASLKSQKAPLDKKMIKTYSNPGLIGPDPQWSESRKQSFILVMAVIQHNKLS